MKILSFCICLLLANTAFNQTYLGSIQANTNPALPSSYNFQEYVFAEPDDQGICTGTTNNTATITEVFMAQTHRHAIGHPLFFTIGFRPALLQLAVTGTGAAPDVQVEVVLNGESLGTLCLNGPSMLSNDINLDVPNFEDYFSVTLPKSWVQPGLELLLTAGNDTRRITSEELKVGPYTELNLVMVNMDILDYNTEPPVSPIFDDFHEELASAIPASVVRFGTFPVSIPFPKFVVTDETETLVLLNNVDEIFDKDIPEGNVNYQASRFLANMQRSTADYLSTYYFGNTLNLTPGGWGGDKNFVSFDFTDIFIHELGHAFSLPHWEEEYNLPPFSEDSNLYPYGGDTNDGGGRGEAWNFTQHTYEFIDPTCKDTSTPNFGIERSDCMQREFSCLGKRTNDFAPWDGFGDFSAISIHRHLIGAEVEIGQVPYRGRMEDYQLRFQDGSPIVSLENGRRIYTRDPLQWQGTYPEEHNTILGEEQIEQDVYLIYGTAHPTQSQANIVYQPLKYQGTLPAIQDPTDPADFRALQQFDVGESVLAYFTRDLTLKLIYSDGSVLHALVPFHSYDREASGDFGVGRADLCNFNLVVPADKDLAKIEVYKRPFCIRDEFDNTGGNINYAPNNITASNFMNEAMLLSGINVDISSASTTPIVDEPQLMVAPNPLDEQSLIQYQLTQRTNVSLEIYNLNGKKIEQLISNELQNAGDHQLTFDADSYSNGIYVLVLRTSEETMVRRLIISQ
ncbi:MAG: M66 family metalloprotease [Bacteroidota bacterium]